MTPKKETIIKNEKEEEEILQLENLVFEKIPSSFSAEFLTNNIDNNNLIENTNNFQEQEQKDNKEYLTVFHNNHFDFLIGGYLYYYKPGGEVQIHELEDSIENPTVCQPIEEISHVKDLDELEDIYSKIEEKLKGKIHNS